MRNHLLHGIEREPIKITDVRVIPLSYVDPDGDLWHSGNYQVWKTDGAITQIFTDQGIVGIGEGTPYEGPGYIKASAPRAVRWRASSPTSRRYWKNSASTGSKKPLAAPTSNTSIYSCNSRKSCPPSRSLAASVSASASKRSNGSTDRPSTSCRPTATSPAGLTENWYIARMAHLRGITSIPHNWHGGGTTMANAHFVAGIAKGEYCELNQTYNPLKEEIFVEPLTVAKGMMELPDRPGFGMELIDDVEKKFPYVEGGYNKPNPRVAS